MCEIHHWLISWGLPLIECFYPLSPGHSHGSRSVVLIRHYGPVVSDQLFSSFFIYSQLDAFSAACLSFPTALLIPNLPSVLHTDWAGNPLHPISTGNSQVLQPRLLHCSCSSVYLPIFLSNGSSHLVSQGTVSSTITSFLSFGDHITMSGLCVVWTTFGKTSCFPRSTFISQQWDSSRIDVVGAFVFLPVWPSLTKLIAQGMSFLLVCRFFLLSHSSMSTSSLRTVLCLHL